MEWYVTIGFQVCELGIKFPGVGTHNGIVDFYFVACAHLWTWCVSDMEKRNYNLQDMKLSTSTGARGSWY